MEAQRGQVTWPESHSCYVAQWGLNPGCLAPASGPAHKSLVLLSFSGTDQTQNGLPSQRGLRLFSMCYECV